MNRGRLETHSRLETACLGRRDCKEGSVPPAKGAKLLTTKSIMTSQAADLSAFLCTEHQMLGLRELSSAVLNA